MLQAGWISFNERRMVILRFVFRSVILWLLAKIFGRFIPILRRGWALFGR
jgi:hypothetical protein